MGWFSTDISTSVADLDETSGLIELSCQCGQKVHGVRTAEARRVPCKGCGAILFLLPISPYPPPRRIPKKTKNKNSSKKKKNVSASRRSPALALNFGSVSGILGKFLTLLAFPFVWCVGNIRRSLMASMRWISTPFRMAFIGTVVILCATGLWTYQRWRVEQANGILTTLPQQGIEYLRAGKIRDAGEILDQIYRALKVTGRNDPEARRLMQLAREVEVVRRLSPGSVEELISEVEDLRGHPGSKWKDYYQRTYQGNWIVLDTTAIQSSGEKGDLQLTFSVNGVRASLVTSLPIVIQGGEKVAPARAIFAGQIRGLKYRSDEGWQVELDPETLVYLTDPQVYGVLGMQTGDEIVDKETERILGQQGKRLEASL